MKKGFYIFLFAIGLIFTSCGSSKTATSKKVESQTVSKAEYAFIQKFHEAVRLKSKGQTSDAILAFEECLIMRPKNDASYYALSQLYLIQNDEQRSGASIKKAADLDPKNVYYLTELAHFYYNQEKYDEAVNCFEKMIALQPDNPEFLYGYAECLVKSGKTKKAIEAINRTENRMGIIPEMSIQKYKLYLEEKQYETAETELTKALDQYPGNPQLLSNLIDYYFNTQQEEKAITTLETLGESDPSNGRVHMFLAEIYRKKGDKKAYLNSLNKAFSGEGVELEDKMKTLIDLQTNQSIVNNETLELARLTAEKHPNTARSHSIYADYLLEMDREEEALEQYKEALVYQKDIYAIWDQVLLMEYQQRKFDSLYSDALACLELYPNFPSVYLFAGVGANGTDRGEEAIDLLNTGIDFIGNNKGILTEFYAQLGEAYFKTKEPKKAKEFYEKALVIEPHSTLLKNNYAFQLATYNQDLDYALKLIKEANEIAPNQPQFIDSYGWVFFKKGEYAKALEYFERAYKLDSKNELIIEHIGDAYSLLNSREKAIEFWLQAKEKGSKSKSLIKKIETGKYYDDIP
ncbi:MAG: tetratricopeptide (TPR) repeat protein [Lentimonas sp.]|jgi:tetratricopeptide (TPR) repeat protein